VKQAVQRLSDDFNYEKNDVCLIASINNQRLYILQNDRVKNEYPISTSSLGVGSEAGSNRTPLGVHQVAQKFGDGAVIGAIFKARQNTGELARIYSDSTNVDEDLVTTRILWLKGLEPGLNQGPSIDSYRRYIYIHGTNEEGLIGQPASHGCIRMKNKDVVELYNLTPRGALVYLID
jgi:hypothetical protein